MNSFVRRVSCALLVALSGGLVLAGCTDSSEQAAPSSAPAAATPPPVPPAAPVSQPEQPVRSEVSATPLGPDGYGTLKLGMTEEQALATGELVLDGPDSNIPPPTCKGYDLADHPSPVDDWAIVISPTHGVIAIADGGNLRTPEGIGAGSTLDRVRNTYPDLTHNAYTGYSAPVPGNESARYKFSFRANRIVSIVLEDVKQDCYG